MIRLVESENVNFQGVLGTTYILNNRLYFLTRGPLIKQVDVKENGAYVLLDKEPAYFKGLGGHVNEMLKMVIENSNLFC